MGLSVAYQSVCSHGFKYCSPFTELCYYAKNCRMWLTLLLWTFSIMLKKHFLCVFKLMFNNFPEANGKYSSTEIIGFLDIKNN